MATKHNRRPTFEERQGISTQIKQDEELISIIKAQLASRQEAYGTTALAVQTATKTLREAELRLTGAEKYYNGVLNSLKQLKSVYPKEDQPPMPAPTEGSAHLAALNRSQKQYIQLVQVVEESLILTHKELRTASEAVAISAENVEGFRTLCRFSEGGNQLLERYVKELEGCLAQKRIPSSSIWYIPDEIWREIFAIVVTEAQEKPVMQPYEIQTLILSDVCVHWRTIIRLYPGIPFNITDKTWNSIDAVTISANIQHTEQLVSYALYRLHNIQSLQISGDTVDKFLDLLSENQGVHHLLNQKEVDGSADNWQFQKLVVSSYVGTGANIARFADKCHEIRYKLLNADASSARANGMGRNNISYETSTLFVAWYFRKRGLGAPTVGRTAGITPAYTMSVQGTVIGITRAFWGITQEQALISCYENSVRKLLNESPNLWDEFLEDIRAGRDGAKRLFKVELNNCEISDASNARNLELYQ
jgi:hypothetical protein